MELDSWSECKTGDCSRLWGQWRRRAFLRKSFCLWLAHEAWSCQKMSEADERVYTYAVILTDTWDHLQKRSNDTELRPCTESYMILEANEVAVNRPRGKCALNHHSFRHQIKYARCPKLPHFQSTDQEANVPLSTSFRHQTKNVQCP